MRGLAAIIAVVCMLFSAGSAMAEKRVAFVVGNGAYRNAPVLPNPPLDAEAMTATLRKAGFDVVEGIDLTRDQMTERLLEFGKKADGADIAVFFYAGHGISVEGANYLLPVDADIKSEMDVRLGAAINMDLMLDQTMGEAKVKLVFLDACRDNPFAARIKASGRRWVSVQSGLAEMKSGENTLIAFATGPGQTALDGTPGADSPFTRALVDNITQPGVEIQQAMTKVRAQVNEETDKGQLPWGSTNLLGAVYLNPQGASATVATKQTTVDFPEERINGALEEAGADKDLPDARTRSLALDQGFEKPGGAAGLPDRLSQRSIQGIQRWRGLPTWRAPRPSARLPAASIPRPIPNKPTRRRKTGLASTGASAAKCSAGSPASASTPRPTENSAKTRVA